MSADNWVICPKCLKEKQKRDSDAWSTLLSDYGNVSAQEWAMRHEMLTKEDESELPLSLREDYEIQMGEDGVLFIYYRSTCMKCNFGYKHKVYISVDIDKPVNFIQERELLTNQEE